MDNQLIQGSPEWKHLRCGLITASRINDVMMKKDATGYLNYQAQLVAERMTGCVAEDGYSNYYIERGNSDEEAARSCYEFATGNTIDQIAFIKHHSLECAGISPDGLCGSDGMIEIKRKIPAHHIRYLLKKEVPAEYRKQMMFQLSATGRIWNEFVSYCPELPPELQLFTCRLERDEEMIKTMDSAVIAFNTSVETLISELKELRG